MAAPSGAQAIMLIKAIIIFAVLLAAAGAFWLRKRRKGQRRIAAHTRWRDRINTDWEACDRS